MPNGTGGASEIQFAPPSTLATNSTLNSFVPLPELHQDGVELDVALVGRRRLVAGLADDLTGGAARDVTLGNSRVCGASVSVLPSRFMNSAICARVVALAGPYSVGVTPNVIAAVLHPLHARAERARLRRRR